MLNLRYNSLMLVDEAEIKLIAGHGGPGKVSFYPGLKSGPDGGNGGRGGDIYIVATSDLTALKNYTVKKTLTAENGHMGESNRKFGHDGEDIEVKIPVGTTLTDQATGQTFDITDQNQRFMICKGGLGGRGNYEFKGPTNTTPMYAQPGLEGQSRDLTVSLKLIADYGLIGLPNAGKSSLLNELTKANAKIGAYPFTTLEPNLGVLNGKVLADIPGLIEGASDGKGLGIRFLKHIEKTQSLIHCVSSETEDFKKDYQQVRQELEKYNPDLLAKPEILLITKSDLVDAKKLEALLKIAKKLNPNVHPTSIHDWDKIQVLEELLKKN